MKSDFQKAFISSVERLSAWSDVLDDINVFPVADGDTGRNLKTSLTPLRYLGEDREKIVNRLLISARGNSGNIAARFFAGFLTADSYELLPQAAKTGRDYAWQAVHNPVPGTMLTVFDALADFLEKNYFEATEKCISNIVDELERAVKSTPQLLPKLKQAGVVDSGALGMYIFLEGFFKSLSKQRSQFQPINETFNGMLAVLPSFQEKTDEGYCVDMVVHFDDKPEDKIKKLTEYSNNVVVIPHQDYLKIHLHTTSKNEVKHQVESLGDIVQWMDDDIGIQINDFKQRPMEGAIHIMTDAAGSVTREDSRQLGITLLDSYISAGDTSLPETLFSPSELYQTMRKGIKVSTSQASVFERHQYYQRVMNQYPKVLYLCVGSVYTGNYDVAMEWKQKNDPDNRFTIIDTTAASGRLGTIVLATAKHSTKTKDPGAVIEFAKRAIHKCEEYVFLDKLKYLAAGGRLSKPSAFFGDMLNVKPIISPTAEGAKKVGAVKNRKGQLGFALEKLEASFEESASPFIMLEYSDNHGWVNDTVKKSIEALYPSSEIRLQPLSLTSGVHMGPGTWGLSFLPEVV